MAIEANSEPFKTERDNYGRPFFVSEVKDTATGVIRRIEKSILSPESTDILLVQTDTFPAFGLVRTVSRTSHLLGEDPVSKALSSTVEEEIRITKIIGHKLDIFRIFATKYREGEPMKGEALSYGLRLWDSVMCGVYYNEDGKISEIFIEPDPEVVREGEKFNMVKISMIKDCPYFEVIDGNQPLGQDVIKSRKIEASELIGSQDFSCMLEDSEDRVLLRIEHNKPEVGKRTISLSKSVDVDKLYAIAATDGFTGWEKALEKANAYLVVTS